MCRKTADAKYNMLNRLEAPARLVLRICLGLFTAAVILLLQSSFWTAAVSGWMRAIILATLVLAYFRPHLVVLFLAVCAPLGQVGSRTLDSNMRGAEALVLAFLAGALVRGWTLHRFRSIPFDTLHLVSFAFGLVVAASCVEQLWFAQLQRDFPGPFLQDVLFYATRRYLITFDGLDMIFSAMLLLEGVALMLYVVHYCRERAEFARRLIVMLVAGAVAAALVNLTFIGSVLLGQRASQINLGLERWTVHIGDVNAAASFFAMASFICLGMAWRSIEQRVAWMAAGTLTGTAFWLTGSRTGLVAVVLVAIALAVRFTVARSLAIWKTSALLFASVTAFGLIFRLGFPHSFLDITATQAVTVRWLFLRTTWAMLREQPLFGIGIGQYALWSAHFSPREMIDYYTRENAHNYFAQIAGELGVAGLVTFVTVLITASWITARRAGRPLDPFLPPLAAGLTVFILTWLGGHPLLVPEVAFPFWIAMGIVPGLLPAPARVPRYEPIVAVVLVAMFTASIAPRVTSKSARIDFTRVTYGLSKGLMEDRARFFVAPGRSQARIPLRARDASPDAPVTVDIFVDDQLSATITFGDSGWQDARIGLKRLPSDAVHKVELRTRETDRDGRVEVGKWEIISTPDA
jgi:hypothetical protein